MFLAQHNINVLEWAAMSPDMSPIEHLWDELKRRVNARAQSPTNVNQLREAVIKEWENIPQQLIEFGAFNATTFYSIDKYQ